MDYTAKTSVYSARFVRVMAWWFDDNNDVHHFETKDEQYQDVGSTEVVSTGSERLVPKVQTPLHFVPRVQSIVLWPNGPTLSWSKFGNDSQNYWSWNSALTIPLPLDSAPIGTFADIAMSIAIVTDSKQPYGTYTQPEGIAVELNGFGSVYKTNISVPKIVHDSWLTDVYVSARAVATEVFPIPHVVIRFNTENLGGVAGSVHIDFDTAVQIALVMSTARMTLRSLT